MAPAPARALPRSRHPVVQLGGAAARRDPVLLLGAVRLHPGHHRVPRGGAPAHEVPTGRASTRRATVHRTVATVHRTFVNLSRPRSLSPPRAAVLALRDRRTLSPLLSGVQQSDGARDDDGDHRARAVAAEVTTCSKWERRTSAARTTTWPSSSTVWRRRVTTRPPPTRR